MLIQEKATHRTQHYCSFELYDHPEQCGYCRYPEVELAVTAGPPITLEDIRRLFYADHRLVHEAFRHLWLVVRLHTVHPPETRVILEGPVDWATWSITLDGTYRCPSLELYTWSPTAACTLNPFYETQEV